ncbi:uncharacterized protein MYCFIDRAFT_179558 [Pseudocercospora fijiensis CIRAD86]|uniref:Uncharacterized protein n=1 Tax=Pseudocercospora fijiensis (strain CIRAD86) TaxID=383855 RepID=M3AKX5_PSEFD|nr:uncharacterized protein MYCFIDRAFT_179558 [Pseudocercospora fijiensis CIRAD86]EME78112.1 hypothetical protein MYCFIDRAFT_179558 [Pseudocercospora fijiensis CIRAD86]
MPPVAIVAVVESETAILAVQLSVLVAPPALRQSRAHNHLKCVCVRWLMCLRKKREAHASGFNCWSCEHALLAYGGDSKVRSKYTDEAQDIFLRADSAVDGPGNNVCTFNQRDELCRTSDIVQNHAGRGKSVLGQKFAFREKLLTVHLREWPLHMSWEGKDPNQDECSGFSRASIASKPLPCRWPPLTREHRNYPVERQESCRSDMISPPSVNRFLVGLVLLMIAMFRQAIYAVLGRLASHSVWQNVSPNQHEKMTFHLGSKAQTMLFQGPLHAPNPMSSDDLFKWPSSQRPSRCEVHFRQNIFRARSH